MYLHSAILPSRLRIFVIALLALGITPLAQSEALYQKNYPWCSCSDGDAVVINVSASGIANGSYTVAVGTTPGGWTNYTINVTSGVCSPSQIQQTVDLGYGGAPGPGRTWSVTANDGTGWVEWGTGADYHGGETCSLAPVQLVLITLSRSL